MNKKVSKKNIKELSTDFICKKVLFALKILKK